MFGISVGVELEFLTAVFALIAACIGWRNHGKIQEIHLTMNSRLDELVAATKASAFAEGVNSAKAEVAGALAAKAVPDKLEQIGGKDSS